MKLRTRIVLLVGIALAIGLVAMTVLAGALLHQAAAEAATGDGDIERLWAAVAAADRVLWLAAAALLAALLGASVAVVRGFLVADLEKLDRSLQRHQAPAPAGAGADEDEVARIQRVLTDLREKLHRLQADKSTGLSAVEDYRAAMARVTEQLTIADRLALTGQLALGVAHEIGGPLSVAQAAMDVLPLLGDDDEDERRQTMRDATDAIVRIDAILRDMNRFGLDKTALRATGGGDAADAIGEGADVAVVVDSVRRLGRIHTKVRRAELRIDDRSQGADVAAMAAIPSGRLEQVLLNLVINAADATDGKGPIAVSWTVAAGRVQLDVADGGAGIPEPQRAQVFEPFFTTKPAERGSGLGLAVSKRLIERFGGTLTVDDDDELGGARMRLDLPAVVSGNRS